jgi:hypothetical protein
VRDRPLVVVRSLPVAAGWVRGQARKLGASLSGAAYQAKSKIVDGYIVRAKRAGRHVTVQIMDTPALIAIPSRLISAGVYSADHCPLVSLSVGRDALLAAPESMPYSQYPSHPGIGGNSGVWAGTAPSVSHYSIDANVRPALASAPGVGLIEVGATLATSMRYSTSPYAFMSRSDRVVYSLLCWTPIGAMVTYTAGEAGGWLPSRDTMPETPVSIYVSDSLLAEQGLLPFSKRVLPPGYDPGSTAATAYAAAQKVWSRVLGISLIAPEDGTRTRQRRLVFACQVVCDMKDDNDRYGAKGLWFAGLLVTEGGDDHPTVELEWRSLWDMRDSIDLRGTPTLTAAGGYTTNNIQPVMLSLIESGVVAVTVSLCYQKGFDAESPDSYQPFSTVTCHRLKGDGELASIAVVGPRLSNLSLYSPMQPHDCAYPCGMDTDGVEAIAVFFSSDSVRQLGFPPTESPSIDIVRVTASGSSVVLSTTIPYRACYFAGVQVTECVRYIGNHKYLFFATDNYTFESGTVYGDWVALIYNAQDSTVIKAGTVDPELRYGGSLILGSMDCPVCERADQGGAVTRPATVLATTGSKAQITGEPGGESGKTYISYDSGASWQVLASYGSPAGVRYCGTMLKARAKEL